MKKMILAAVLGATAVSGVAVAQQQAPANAPRPPHAMRGDANRDGVVTRDEFMAQAAQHFARMDANKDNRIDQAERRAMRADRREHRKERRGHRGGMRPGVATPTPGN